MNQVDEIIPRMMLFASPLSRVPRACFCPLAVKFLPEVRGIAEAIAFGTYTRIDSAQQCFQARNVATVQ